MSNQDPPLPPLPPLPPPPHDPQANPYATHHPAHHATPHPGLPSYTGPAQDPGYGYGYGPVALQKMPGSLRAAQIVIWVLAGLTMLGSVAIAASGDAQTAGAAAGANVCILVAAGFAFSFQSAGHGVRVTCIVLMSVQILFGLGALAGGNAGGGLALLGSIAAVILLSTGNVAAWFKRPRQS
ncbi:hypothetical protein AB0I94_04375 [Streptomyces sp. NPDC050147]|uniref:hypothetical protein n=1 Tax=Streptomyces sp. NPDC050147 TaxID=3155513 RepID=UPI00342920C2